MTPDISERTHSEAYSAGAAAGLGALSTRFVNGTPDLARNSRRNPYIAPFTNGILSNLPQQVLAKIVPQLRPVQMRRDKYVYQPEDPIHYFYFPETTVFSEYQMLEDGRTIEIAMMGNETVIGLETVFSPGRALNWTQVCIAGTAWKIESEFFRRVIGHESAVKALLNKQITSYIRHISQKVICNAHHSVEERLCTWLLMLQDRCGTQQLNLTQEQIARVLGVFRPSITCTASGLRTRRLIDYVRGKIIIRDREKLIDAACSCYREFAIRKDQQTFSQKAYASVM